MLARIVNKIGYVSKLLSHVGAVILFLMMILTTVDVAGRYLFNAPIMGVFEITEFMMVGIVFLSMAYTHSKKGHVAVDIVVMRFPKRVQNVINIVNHVISFSVLGLISWKSFMRGFEIMAFQEVSATLHIPSFPFVFLVALGCAAMAIEILKETIQLVMGLDSL